MLVLRSVSINVPFPALSCYIQGRPIAAPAPRLPSTTFESISRMVQSLFQHFSTLSTVEIMHRLMTPCKH